MNNKSTKNILLSIVVPCYNEVQNIVPLTDEITEILAKCKYSYELIYVDDGSIDASSNIIDEICKQNRGIIKAIHFRKNSGKAAALQAGFQMANGKYIIQLDADLQDDPKEIPAFIEKLENGADMVVGWKHKRLDSFVKNKTSLFFNSITNLISNVKLHDHNCGYKGYRSEVAKSLRLYGELHRYIAVLVSNRGYVVHELPVRHRVRAFGKTKYGPIRFVNGFLDLFTVLFITRFSSRPLHLFGYIGITFFILGFIMSFNLMLIKFIWNQSIGNRPLLLFSVMLMIMGVQIGVVGLLSEQIAAVAHKNNPDYEIKNKIL